MIKITVITVCRNAEVVIGNTIESVFKQNYKNIEYIVVDGKSTDKTIDVIEPYLRCYPINFSSEKDTGIYDAMNKGIQRATGDYIFFLNAGDTFCGKYVIERAADCIKQKKADVYYGNVIIKYIGHYEYFRFNDGTLLALLLGVMPCHQSIFVRSSLLKKEMFDLKYSLRADYNWLVRAKKKKYHFVWLKQYISYYSATGCSSRSNAMNKMKQETKLILYVNYPILARIIYPLRDTYFENRERSYKKKRTTK